MAKILSFRNKGTGAASQHFLTDETEKLSFRTSEDGAVSLGDMARESLPDVLPDPKKDWSNQELADLFRVHKLLSGAGVPVETLRGVTDEGDPWFVYCHLDGNVFIHMARIDGFYVLDSPNVHRPLRGVDFNALIADFTSDALPTYAKVGDDNTERRVIKLERGGKVQLHPSAMLAALIWTLFLASEELVMIAAEEEALAADDLLDFSHVISDDFDPQMFEMETADMSHLAVAETAKDTQDDALASTPEGQAQMREIMAQQGLAMQQNAYAMGLSTIAIAMGFMSEAVLLDNQRKVLEGLKSLGFSEYAATTESGSELTDVAGDGGDPLLAMLAEFLGLDLSLNTETADVAGQATLLEEDVAHLTAVIVDEGAALTDKTTQAVVRENEDAELAEAPADQTHTPVEAQAQETVVALTVSQDSDDTITMSDLLSGQYKLEDFGLEEFQLGQTVVLASFDVTDSDVSELSGYIVENQDVRTTDLRTTDHREFDDQAQSFIDYIQGKDTEVGIITIGNEIIMIDRDAFRHDGSDTYTFSWETDEGQVISMIGLRSEFQQFDLIA